MHVLAALLALLSACALAATALAAAPPLRLGQAANGCSVRLARGQELVLTLPANASTGYRWFLRSRPRGLVLVSERYLPPRSRLFGAPGQEQFHFRARTAGRGALRLSYRRSLYDGTAALDFLLLLRT